VFDQFFEDVTWFTQFW